jgi:hypothetical protein
MVPSSRGCLKPSQREEAESSHIRAAPPAPGKTIPDLAQVVARIISRTNAFR